jgi:hypothetical protein
MLSDSVDGQECKGGFEMKDEKLKYSDMLVLTTWLIFFVFRYREAFDNQHWLANAR